MSLLPANLPHLEHILDEAEGRMSDIDIPTETIWDPWNCPVSVLPFLAWSLSVDVWNSNWSVQLQRQVTAASLELHQYKGTAKGVKLALSSLGLDYDYSEWWQESPRGQPGTFKVTAYVNSNLANDSELLGPKNLALVKRLIDSNKRGSAHYEFNLGLGIDGELSFSCANESVKVDIDKVISPPVIAVDDVSACLSISVFGKAYSDVDVVVSNSTITKSVSGQLALHGAAFLHQQIELVIG